MFQFAALISLGLCALGVLTAPSQLNQIVPRTTPSQEGFKDGFYYKWEVDDTVNANFTNGPEGNFTIAWGMAGLAFGGKGWNPGKKHKMISYSGTYRYNGNSLLGVFGRTTNPLVEYLIIDNYGTFFPASHGTRKGVLETSNGIYELVHVNVYRVNEANVTEVHPQYWAVRRNKRVGGCIDFGAFVTAWKDLGMELGKKHEYQIVGVEGYFSNGEAVVSVKEGCPA